MSRIRSLEGREAGIVARIIQFLMRLNVGRSINPIKVQAHATRPMLASFLANAVMGTGRAKMGNDLRELVKRLGAIRLTSYAMLVSTFAVAVQFTVLNPWSALALPSPVYWLSLVNGIVCTVLPVFAIMLAVERIGAGTTSLASMVVASGSCTDSPFKKARQHRRSRPHESSTSAPASGPSVWPSSSKACVRVLRGLRWMRTCHFWHP